MAHMFYAMGHILHLNQDLSQPDHVRNDEHLHPWHRWIEKFGTKTYLHEADAFPLEPQGWSYWQSQGFSKILDFWDRNLYADSSSQGLIDDANGVAGKQLGLAEFSNGNFLGEDATYAEFFKPGDIHYFPFPSLKNTTQPQINPRNLSGTAIDTVTLADDVQGQRIYLSKTNAGINIVHHSALHYFAVRHASKINTSGMGVGLTINDTNVLQEYHSILIPKAIEYSAGILDYFFRGTLSASVVGYDTNSMRYTNLIVNTSGQDFYGGAFSIYEDDTNGFRTFVTQTNFSGKTLLNSNSLIMTFPGPVYSITNLLLVYQGTIGITNGNSALDPVDAGIGIAASKVLPLEQTINYDYLMLLSDLGLTNGSTIVSNLESGEFLFALTAGHYEVTVNFALFDDKGTIGSLPSTGPLGNCDNWPCEITNTVVPAGDVSISPDGKSLSIPITATDNADCGQYIGWWDVSVTWRAWPATQ